ncbi:MAG: thioredoxin family protein [Clostridia bacterium]|nr:thioredoxin family protein [Clostridia bacterium]MDH7573117.1 thioredoxin family protein [Clostridia bacterium]
MTAIKVEAFLGANEASAEVERLLQEVTAEFGEQVELVVYREPNELFDEYSLTLTPAIVVDEMVKIEGFCPSRETVAAAIRNLLV